LGGGLVVPPPHAQHASFAVRPLVPELSPNDAHRPVTSPYHAQSSPKTSDQSETSKHSAVGLADVVGEADGEGEVVGCSV